MRLNPLELTPEKLLPHAHPMILLDAVDSYGEDFAQALVTPGPDSPFADPAGNVPSWVGMEYMAQTIAIFAGIQARQQGLPIKVGLLLGTRSYNIEVEQFCCHQLHSVHVQQIITDGSLSAFDCTISSVGNPAVLAQAVINAYQPENIDDFFIEHTE